MSSIKLEVLSQIAKRKQCSRQDVQKFIWVAQGNNIKDYVNRQGYYGTNIVSWKYNGLVDNDTKNVFKITKKGKEYIKNPNAYNKAMRMARESYQYILDRRDDELCKKIQELRGKICILENQLQQAKERNTLQDALDYFSATDGNYSAETAYYLRALINNITK